MQNKIKETAQKIKAATIQRRREFHKYAETAWTEFRTAAVVADTLASLGYEVLTGEEVIDNAAMMGVPDDIVLKENMERALSQGAKPVWVKKMKGGKTGVVGIMKFSQPGPTVALRFDMDANDVLEAADEEHRPFQENFSSINPGAMHACAHDGHTAVGLAVAEILSLMSSDLKGTIKLIFQPGEEGVRGAKSMVEKGIVDDVDYFLGMHLGVSLNKTGLFAYKVDGFLATTKIDAVFTGTQAHAGAHPEAGNNALLAAASAALNLHAIAPHSQGTARINVGVMHAGTGRNVIPGNAILSLETRGKTTEINEYVYKRAVSILEHSAAMYGTNVALKVMGGAAGLVNSLELADKVKAVAESLDIFDKVVAENDAGGSEDCTYFMERVQKHSGQAVYTIVGANLAAVHHNARFDFDEAALEKAVVLLASCATELLSKK